jgi:hypothetical protein
MITLLVFIHHYGFFKHRNWIDFYDWLSELVLSLTPYKELVSIAGYQKKRLLSVCSGNFHNMMAADAVPLTLSLKKPS